MIYTLLKQIAVILPILFSVVIFAKKRESTLTLMDSTADLIRFIIPVCPMSLQTSGKQMVIRKGRPIFFKTQKASDYQKIIRLYASQHRPKEPWECPIYLQVDYFLERPARLNTKAHGAGAQYHDKRPDLDNLQKGTQDAFKGFWLDDSQIVALNIRKYYCPFGEKPWIAISMSKLNKYNDQETKGV